MINADLIVNTSNLQNMTREVWEEIIKYGAYTQELDWYAIDRNGNLGMFTATMHAPIPQATKVSYEKYVELKQIINLLPKITSSILTTTEEGNFPHWIAHAEKGLFAFDFQDIHRKNAKDQYDLIASPMSPLNLGDITISAKILNTLVKLECDFTDGDLKTELIK